MGETTVPRGLALVEEVAATGNSGGLSVLGDIYSLGGPQGPLHPDTARVLSQLLN